MRWVVGGGGGIEQWRLLEERGLIILLFYFFRSGISRRYSSGKHRREGEGDGKENSASTPQANHQSIN